MLLTTDARRLQADGYGPDTATRTQRSSASCSGLSSTAARTTPTDADPHPEDAAQLELAADLPHAKATATPTSLPPAWTRTPTGRLCCFGCRRCPQRFRLSNATEQARRAACQIVEAFGSHNVASYFAGFDSDASFVFYTEPRIPAPGFERHTVARAGRSRSATCRHRPSGVDRRRAVPISGPPTGEMGGRIGEPAP